MIPDQPASQPGTEQRREPRRPIASLVLPFLGSREADHQPFQYLLEDTSQHGARISLPHWLVAGERLRDGETVNLHLPFRLGGGGDALDQGRVAWVRWDEAARAQLCGIRLEGAAPPFYPIQLELGQDTPGVDLGAFASPGDVALQALKDSYLLKRGVSIYLKHLLPYLSRVADYSREDFLALKEVFLSDVRERVRAHQLRLGELYRQAAGLAGGEGEIVAGLDLEELRELSTSELSSAIFQTAFAGDLAARQLAAIKTLEKRLYGNYNSIIMIYLRLSGKS